MKCLITFAATLLLIKHTSPAPLSTVAHSAEAAVVPRNLGNTQVPKVNSVVGEFRLPNDINDPSSWQKVDNGWISVSNHAGVIPSDAFSTQNNTSTRQVGDYDFIWTSDGHMRIFDLRPNVSIHDAPGNVTYKGPPLSSGSHIVYQQDGNQTLELVINSNPDYAHSSHGWDCDEEALDEYMKYVHGNTTDPNWDSAWRRCVGRSYDHYLREHPSKFTVAKMNDTLVMRQFADHDKAPLLSSSVNCDIPDISDPYKAAAWLKTTFTTTWASQCSGKTGSGNNRGVMTSVNDTVLGSRSTSPDTWICEAPANHDSYNYIHFLADTLKPGWSEHCDPTPSSPWDNQIIPGTDCFSAKGDEDPARCTVNPHRGWGYDHQTKRSRHYPHGMHENLRNAINTRVFGDKLGPQDDIHLYGGGDRHALDKIPKKYRQLAWRLARAHSQNVDYHGDHDPLGKLEITAGLRSIRQATSDGDKSSAEAIEDAWHKVGGKNQTGDPHRYKIYSGAFLHAARHIMSRESIEKRSALASPKQPWHEKYPSDFTGQDWDDFTKRLEATSWADFFGSDVVDGPVEDSYSFDDWLVANWDRVGSYNTYTLAAVRRLFRSGKHSNSMLSSVFNTTAGLDGLEGALAKAKIPFQGPEDPQVASLPEHPEVPSEKVWKNHLQSFLDEGLSDESGVTNDSIRKFNNELLRRVDQALSETFIVPQIPDDIPESSAIAQEVATGEQWAAQMADMINYIQRHLQANKDEKARKKPVTTIYQTTVRVTASPSTSYTTVVEMVTAAPPPPPATTTTVLEEITWVTTTLVPWPVFVGYTGRPEILPQNPPDYPPPYTEGDPPPPYEKETPKQASDRLFGDSNPDSKLDKITKGAEEGEEVFKDIGKTVADDIEVADNIAKVAGTSVYEGSEAAFEGASLLASRGALAGAESVSVAAAIGMDGAEDGITGLALADKTLAAVENGVEIAAEAAIDVGVEASAAAAEGGLMAGLSMTGPIGLGVDAVVLIAATTIMPIVDMFKEISHDKPELYDFKNKWMDIDGDGVMEYVDKYTQWASLNNPRFESSNSKDGIFSLIARAITKHKEYARLSYFDERYGHVVDRFEGNKIPIIQEDPTMGGELRNILLEPKYSLNDRIEKMLKYFTGLNKADNDLLLKYSLRANIVEGIRSQIAVGMHYYSEYHGTLVVYGDLDHSAQPGLYIIQNYGLDHQYHWETELADKTPLAFYSTVTGDDPRKSKGYEAGAITDKEWLSEQMVQISELQIHQLSDYDRFRWNVDRYHGLNGCTTVAPESTECR